jgi:hypothetical protein
VNYTRKQRGGTEWQILSKDPDWVTSWDLPDDLKFVLEFGRSQDHAKMLQEYITIIERQDEIFAHAMKAVYKKLGIDENADEATIINKLTSQVDLATRAIKSYIGDVGKLIYFNEGNEVKKTGTGKPTYEVFMNNITKIKTILDSNKTPAVELLLNPEQVQNQFIKYLASVCIIQKKYPDILTKASGDINVKMTRALRYEATSEANAYAITSNRLRDGFYAIQLITDFQIILGHGQGESMKGFWWNFISRCNGDNKPVYKSKVKEKLQDRFSYLTTVVFKLYKDTDIKATKLKEAVINKLIMDFPVSAKENPEYNVIHLPGILTINEDGTRKFDDKQISQIIFGSVTLQKLLEIMTIGEIQFILHLCYTITKIEEQVLTEVRAMTPETAVLTA